MFNLIFISLNIKELIFKNSQSNTSSGIFSKSFMLILIFQLPLFIIAFDWFRFINLSFTYALIILVNYNDKQIDFSKNLNYLHNKINSFFDIFLKPNKDVVIFIALFTIIPHYKLGNTLYQFSNTTLIITNPITKIINYTIGFL
ncbi:hypothetical protein HMPREF2660_07985 [Weeksella sp. HMSC059D05]|nr:hypothetical protein HMPREF2660_07985 [Weeksella sp. HMSC059D05]